MKTFEMITIPAGSVEIRRFKDTQKWLSTNYKMSIPSSGKNQQQTTENVIVNSFQMSNIPVTVMLYNKILNTPTLNSKTGDLPKVDISWFDAINFCNSMSKYYNIKEYYTFNKETSEVKCNTDSEGFRLPTDAEWQYACRAEENSYQYADIDIIAWHKGNSNNLLQPVGQKKPNSWELYDMLGNIWEWTWDLYNQETYPNYRIFRGGSFAEQARICGSTTRRKSHPNFAIDDLGFRIVKSI